MAPKLSIVSTNLLVHVVIEQHPFIETISVLCFAHVIFKFLQHSVWLLQVRIQELMLKVSEKKFKLLVKVFSVRE